MTVAPAQAAVAAGPSPTPAGTRATARPRRRCTCVAYPPDSGHTPSSGSCPVLARKRHFAERPDRHRSHSPHALVTPQVTRSPTVNCSPRRSVAPAGWISTISPTLSCPRIDGHGPERRPVTVWMSDPHTVEHRTSASASPAPSAGKGSCRVSKPVPPVQT